MEIVCNYNFSDFLTCFGMFCWITIGFVISGMGLCCILDDQGPAQIVPVNAEEVFREANEY